MREEITAKKKLLSFQGKNAEAWYYEKYYLSDHRDYLTPQRTNYEARQLIRWLGRRPSAVCDIGSGDGRHLAAFANFKVARGYGFDASRTLVKLAEDRLKNYQKYLVERKTFSDWKPRREQYDLAYSIFSAFGHCRNSNEAERLIVKAVTSLKDGGLLCIDVDSVFRLISYLESRGKEKRREVFSFDAIKMVLSSREVRNKEILISKTRYFIPSDFESMLVGAGIKKSSIRFLGSFDGGRYSHQSPRLIILAKK